ncbi:hypothetical protein SAMN04487943_106165 [Gracilibacillus orientalis]|uniref:Uncharacterized protein n=1 Tax=Gracilibacillus orientalis TaxID=334253 RepID=A0A1I4MCT7_9BACI|nr:hypothetical protein [Gracilibacillus orientalis]SFM00883.1 hypothetical protein SAMN04487943_106165 [Gracilibacillus orientalis]
MLKFIKSYLNANEPSVKLFEGERKLVITGLFGVILSLGIASFIYFQGHLILPEGNMKDVFSFNAAIGIYILSIAAILPLARFGDRKRKVIRWLFISATLYSYAIETVQNFRGINPRFSSAGTNIDMVAGMLFGIVSLVLVALAIVLTIHFLRMKSPHERPLLLLGVRYAFTSVTVASIAGIWMILLQDRLTGDAGNIIVLHGIGFHALQTLILLAWFLEKTQAKWHYKKILLHSGSIAWILMILFIGIQTALGRSVFELTIIPILGSCLLFVWLGTVIMAVVLVIKQSRNDYSSPIDQPSFTE